MKDMELYYGISLDALIQVEKALDIFDRPAYSVPVDYELEDPHFYVLDNERHRVILFIDGLRQPITGRLNIAQQIFEHWILGFTVGETPEKPPALKRYTSRNRHLTEDLLDLFFSGSRKQLLSLREELNLDREPKNEPDWMILHHPFELVAPLMKGDERNNEGEDDNADESSIHKQTRVVFNTVQQVVQDLNERYTGYSIWLAYGVVSRSQFQRTDKDRIRNLVHQFLSQHDFDRHSTHLTHDVGRSYEPVVLWHCNHSIQDTNLDALVGVNFGYDNGRSGYRLGIGLYIADEDLTIKQIERRLLVSNNNMDDTLSAFQSWIHHRDYGDIEERLQHFFHEHFRHISDRILDLIDNAKGYSFKSGAISERVVMNTHRTAFQYMHEQLRTIHDEFVDKYGYNRYAHVLTWARLAEMIHDGSRIRSLADFIAASILGLPGPKTK